MKTKFLTLIIIVLLLILGLSLLASPPEENSKEITNKTEVRICVDAPFELDYFISQLKTLDYYQAVNDTTLDWLESLQSNHIVFSSSERYYIMSDYDVSKLPPFEYATDVSVYDVCNCTIEENRNLGIGLGNVTLLGNVYYLYQDVKQYPV